MYMRMLILKFLLSTFFLTEKDEGKLVEFDHPYILMQTDDSIFKTMCERSGEFTELLDVAKAKYEKDLISGNVDSKFLENKN